VASGPHRVLWVVDGDTIQVDMGGRKEMVRFLYINTPERRQHGYEEATAALTTLIAGRAVTLEFEGPGRARRDKYGRLLAYVRAGDLNLNLEMVRQGMTRFYTVFGRGDHARAFEQAEAGARASRAGLWTAEGFNPRPWGR